MQLLLRAMTGKQAKVLLVLFGSGCPGCEAKNNQASKKCHTMPPLGIAYSLPVAIFRNTEPGAALRWTQFQQRARSLIEDLIPLIFCNVCSRDIVQGVPLLENVVLV